MDKVHYQSITVAGVAGVLLRMAAKQSTGVALGGAIASYFIANKLLVDSRDNSKINIHSKEPEVLRR
jgi:hypothetical protein